MAVLFITAEELEKARGEALGRGRFLVTERLCRTHDGQLVTEDKCIEGGNLAYQPGQEIPIEEARAVGLIAEVPAAPPLAAADAVDLTPTPPAADAPAESKRKRGK